MSTFPKHLFAAAGLLAILAPPVAAHPDGRPGPHVTAPDARGRYLDYDRDRDGRLSAYELDAYWRAQASRPWLGAGDDDERRLLVRVAPTLDRDHDGRLERFELRAWRTLLDAQRELKRLDTNWSGRLNPDEAAGSTFFAPRMTMLDLDRNGRVQPDELTRAMLYAYQRGDRAFVARFGARHRGSIYVEGARPRDRVDRDDRYDRYDR